MNMAILNKVIIVEGKSDKKKVQQVIAEPVNIICTHGTMSMENRSIFLPIQMMRAKKLESGLNVI